jgi:tol-pal system protein YbgF
MITAQSVAPLRACASALSLALLFGAAPAHAQGSGQGETSRLETFQEDAGQFFGGLFGSSERNPRPRRQPAQETSPGPGHEGGSTVAQAGPSDLSVRLDRLENQIRQLTGSIEQLQFRNQQLEQQLRRNQEDVDFRLQELGGKGAPRRASQPVSPPPPASPPPGRRSDAFDPNAEPGAPGAPQTLGSVTPSSEEPAPGAGRPPGAPLDLANLNDRRSDAGPDATAAAPPRTPASGAEPRLIPGALPPPPPRNPSATGAPRQQVAAAPPTATPRDEFALAQGYVQRRDYALAEEGLRKFLAKHPSDRLVAEAHYWLGESLFQRQRYRDAAESFLTVSTKFEKSGKAGDSLLRLGQSLAALGEKEAACATLGEVVRKYPKAANLKQSVERERKRVRC